MKPLLQEWFQQHSIPHLWEIREVLCFRGLQLWGLEAQYLKVLSALLFLAWSHLVILCKSSEAKEEDQPHSSVTALEDLRGGFQ